MALLSLASRCAVASSTLLVALAFSTLPTQAHAQQYKSIPLKIQPAQAKVMAPKVATIFRQGGALAPADQKILDDFFTYYFSAMTSPAPEQLAQLSKMRKDLFQLYLNVANGTEPPREHVMGLSIKATKAIAKGNFHPAVRYNATLILGQLDKTPGRTGAGGGAAPVPLPAATAALVELLEAAAADPAAVAPPVVVGALVGLERHTRLGVDPTLADKITAASLAVATNGEAPEGVSQSVHSWMQALAARVVANQSAKGLAAPSHEALVKLVLDKKMILDDRCLIAESIKTPMYKDVKGVNIDEMAAAIGVLAKDVLADETKKAEGYLKKSGIDDSGANPGAFNMPAPGGFGGGEMGRGGFGGGFGGGMGAGGLAALDDTTPHYEKRRMLNRILAVRSAANALAAAGSPELTERLEALTKPIGQVADEAVKPKATDAEIVDSVLKLADEVNRLVADWKPAAGGAPAAEPAAPAEPAAEPPAEAAAGN